MSTVDFWVVFFENTQYYFFITVVVFSFMFLMSRVFRISVFHPTFFYVFFNYQFALIAVLYLSGLGYISLYLSNYFYYSQAAFWIGFLFFYIIAYTVTVLKEKGSAPVPYVFSVSNGFFITYKVSFFIYLLCTLTTYLLFGIPLLAESKWSVYSSIPLAGLIGRVGKVSAVFVLVCFFVKFLNFNRFSLFDKSVIFYMVLSGVLSGAKVFFLKYFFILYLMFWLAGYKLSKKTIYRSMVFFVFSFFLILVGVYFHQLITNDVKVNPLFLILQRLAMSGDLQIMTYPDGLIDTLNYGETLSSILFYELKGFFSVFGIDIAGPAIGSKIMKYHFPNMVANIGPASTFETFFYVYFESISLFLCFFVGGAIGFITKYKFKIKNEAFLIFYILIALGIYTLIYNPQVWISETIFNVVYFLFFYSFIKLRLALYAK